MGVNYQQIREMRESLTELRKCGFECEAGGLESSVAFQTIHLYLCCMECVEHPNICHVCNEVGHCKHCIVIEEYCGLKLDVKK